MAPVIDGYLGLRSKLIGYQYSEISLAMLCNFCCGGDRTEDIYHIHDMIGQKPGLRICSPDTVLRAMTELAEETTVIARWTRGGRRDIPTLYTSNAEAFQTLFADYG